MIFRSINPCLVKRKLAKKKQMVLSSLPLYTSLPSSTLARLHLFFLLLLNATKAQVFIRPLLSNPQNKRSREESYY